MTAAPNRYLEEQSPSAGTGWLDRLVRRYWIRRTGSDPVIILNQLRALEALNSLHVEWCEQLEITHPELKAELDKHERGRFDLLNPPNARTELPPPDSDGGSQKKESNQ